MLLDSGMGHAHHEWLKDAGDDIERDYQRLFKKAARHGACDGRLEALGQPASQRLIKAVGGWF